MTLKPLACAVLGGIFGFVKGANNEHGRLIGLEIPFYMIKYGTIGLIVGTLWEFFPINITVERA